MEKDLALEEYLAKIEEEFAVDLKNDNWLEDFRRQILFSELERQHANKTLNEYLAKSACGDSVCKTQELQSPGPLPKPPWRFFEELE